MFCLSTGNAPTSFSECKLAESIIRTKEKCPNPRENKGVGKQQNISIRCNPKPYVFSKTCFYPLLTCNLFWDDCKTDNINHMKIERNNGCLLRYSRYGLYPSYSPLKWLAMQVTQVTQRNISTS